MDTVFLEEVQFYGYHGVNPAERTQGQRFIVDVELGVDLRAAGQSDDLTRTLDYSAVYQIIQAIVEGPPRRLLEAVAEEIAATLLAGFPAQTITVTIRKPAPPLRGAMLRAAGVRIQRERGAP
jgi:7,8-dihydroneopterin aldolase/epimerase/oxygenase